MKIKISPQSLKPGQLFDAKPLFEQGYPLLGFTYLGIQGSKIKVSSHNNEFGLLTAHLYDFFIEVSHPDLVRHTAKSGEAILAELTPQKCDYMHFGSNLAGEVGELWDNLKGHIFYGKEIDRENLIEELGDLEWYLEGLRQTAGITREETLDHNIGKLSKRYAGGYSNAAAQERLDKAVEQATVMKQELERSPVNPRPVSDREWAARPAGDRETDS